MAEICSDIESMFAIPNFGSEIALIVTRMIVKKCKQTQPALLKIHDGNILFSFKMVAEKPLKVCLDI